MSRLFVAALLIIYAVQPAFSQGHPHGDDEDRVSFGSDITVNEDGAAGDIACAFCTVRLHGDAKGDVAVLFGSVTLDSGHTISGDVAVLGGDVSIGDDATVDGDLALAAGSLHLSPDATIHGDRAILPGRLWLLVPLAPLLILAGIIWLIVWLIRRNRYPQGYPQAPGVRRF